MTSSATNELCNTLARLYNSANEKGREPAGFEISLFQAYKEAYRQGAIFFGPLAVVKVNWYGNTEWHIKDLRGGWGYDPIDEVITLKEGEAPTAEIIAEKLQERARAMQHRANCLCRTAKLLTK